ncbi:MAG: TonB family protein [Halioglobus sp.]|nr:TonB family protein [Halioglobus sp.]
MGKIMKNTIRMLCLCSAVIAALSTAVLTPARAVESGFRLTGLGLHQDTGRDIYLGGIYLRNEVAQPENFTESPGPRIMEYRIIARRTSMRSLLGGMLLQSQIATDKAPDNVTADFIDTILSAVNQSLYAGDSLEIELTQTDATVARLNDLELARVDNATVANYLLMGWVGETGPSTLFRDTITSGEVDPSLLAKLEANTYTAQRQSQIGEGLQHNSDISAHDPGTGQPATPNAAGGMSAQPAKPNVEEVQTAQTVEHDSQQTQPAAASVQGAQTTAVPSAQVSRQPRTAQLEPIDEPAAQIVRNTASEVGVTGTAVATTAPIARLRPVTVDAQYRKMPQAAITDTGETVVATVESTENNGGAMQLASLEPAGTMPSGNPLEREIRSLGLQEYFQRLATFHGDMVRRVYGEISYPRRAVRRSLEGRLELDVTLTATGELLAIQIVHSSGHRILDDAAVSAARAAFAEASLEDVDPVAIAEFGDFDRGELTVPVPVNFRLE